jgi:predicted DNA-binding transcriptional regulator AlpA
VKPEKIARMPDWPARMGEDLAALYLGISASNFRIKVRDRLYPQPVREGARLLWSRAQLDRFIATQFGLPIDGGGTAGASAGSWDDL